MIFAAGLGTRLKPLTDEIPKALVNFRGKTLLEHTIIKLKENSTEEVVINVHHFADKIEEYLGDKNYFDISIRISDERNLLLDTGGGLLKAKEFLYDTDLIIIHNVDIISDIDLSKMINYHKESKSLATLAVQRRESSRKLVFDSNNYLCQWKDIKKSEIKIARKSNAALTDMSFCGIHLIDPKIFNLITETAKFSIIDLYLRLAEDHKISSYESKHTYWFDIGSLEKIRKAESFFDSI